MKQVLSIILSKIYYQKFWEKNSNHSSSLSKMPHQKQKVTLPDHVDYYETELEKAMLRKKQREEKKEEDHQASQITQHQQTHQISSTSDFHSQEFSQVPNPRLVQQGMNMQNIKHHMHETSSTNSSTSNPGTLKSSNAGIVDRSYV